MRTHTRIQTCARTHTHTHAHTNKRIHGRTRVHKHAHIHTPALQHRRLLPPAAPVQPAAAPLLDAFAPDVLVAAAAPRLPQHHPTMHTHTGSCHDPFTPATTTPYRAHRHTHTHTHTRIHGGTCMNASGAQSADVKVL